MSKCTRLGFAVITLVAETTGTVITNTDVSIDAGSIVSAGVGVAVIF